MAEELEYNAGQLEQAGDLAARSQTIRTTAWDSNRDTVRRWLRPSPPLLAFVTDAYYMLERMRDEGEKPPPPDRLRSAASRLRATLL